MKAGTDGDESVEEKDEAAKGDDESGAIEGG